MDNFIEKNGKIGKKVERGDTVSGIYSKLKEKINGSTKGKLAKLKENLPKSYLNFNTSEKRIDLIRPDEVVLFDFENKKLEIDRDVKEGEYKSISDDSSGEATPVPIPYSPYDDAAPKASETTQDVSDLLEEIPKADHKFLKDVSTDNPGAIVPVYVERFTKVKEAIKKASEKYNIDAEVLKAICYIESRFDANDQSGISWGIMQLTPWAPAEFYTDKSKRSRERYKDAKNEYFSKDPKILNLETNLEIGIKYWNYIKAMIIKNGISANFQNVMYIYNEGPGRIKKLQNITNTSDKSQMMNLPFASVNSNKIFNVIGNLGMWNRTV